MGLRPRKAIKSSVAPAAGRMHRPLQEQETREGGTSVCACKLDVLDAVGALLLAPAHRETHALAANEDAQTWRLQLETVDGADAVKANARTLFGCEGDWSSDWAARMLAHAGEEAIDCLLLGADPSALADPLCL